MVENTIIQRPNGGERARRRSSILAVVKAAATLAAAAKDKGLEKGEGNRFLVSHIVILSKHNQSWSKVIMAANHTLSTCYDKSVSMTSVAKNVYMLPLLNDLLIFQRLRSIFFVNQMR